MKNLIATTLMLLSATSAFSAENLVSQARKMALELEAGSDQVIVGVKTSKQFFSVSGLLFSDQVLIGNDVAVRGKNTFYRVSKNTNSIVVSACGVVLMMEPSSREWSVPESLNVDILIETVVFDSQGEQLESAFHDHYSSRRENHCVVVKY